ncbi:unnamed protein product [Cyprideis torosa]|uniref:Uncharacterized protein n=1 Tax=Cyprideis torosa TaxID=163714 RepID=A0A7R8ZR92_9CRUS|nr:unnamed protein product [Cyprideis torosa]CAG0898364.1 unnamed protein product [Cyprideis torosa]
MDSANFAQLHEACRQSTPDWQVKVVSPRFLRQLLLTTPSTSEAVEIIAGFKRPVYNLTLYKKRFSFQGFVEKNYLQHLYRSVQNMGGSVMQSPNHTTTHLVARKAAGEKYIYCGLFDIPRLKKDFIQTLWDRRDEEELKVTPEMKPTLFPFERKPRPYEEETPPPSGGRTRRRSRTSSLNIKTPKRKRQDASILSPGVSSPMTAGGKSTLNSRNDTIGSVQSIDISQASISSPDPRKEAEGVDSSSHIAPVPPRITGRKQVFMELVQTEKNYVNVLQTIMTVHDAMLKQDLLPDKFSTDLLFGSIEPILTAHLALREDLETLLEDWNEDCQVGECLIKHMRSETFAHAYKRYIKDYDSQKQLLEKLSRNSRFFGFLNAMRGRPEYGRQSLTELLIRPVQRLPSVTLLIKDLRKQTSPHFSDHEHLDRALMLLQTVLDRVNEERRLYDQRKELMLMVTEIEDCPPEMVSVTRQFLREFEALDLSGTIKNRRCPLALFLLSDLLLICKKRKGGEATGGVLRSGSFKSEAGQGGQRPSSGPRQKPYKYLRQVPLRHVRKVYNLISRRPGGGLVYNTSSAALNGLDESAGGGGANSTPANQHHLHIPPPTGKENNHSTEKGTSGPENTIVIVFREEGGSCEQRYIFQIVSTIDPSSSQPAGKDDLISMLTSQMTSVTCSLDPESLVGTVDWRHFEEYIDTHSLMDGIRKVGTKVSRTLMMSSPDEVNRKFSFRSPMKRAQSTMLPPSSPAQPTTPMAPPPLHHAATLPFQPPPPIRESPSAGQQQSMLQRSFSNIWRKRNEQNNGDVANTRTPTSVKEKEAILKEESPIDEHEESPSLKSEEMSADADNSDEEAINEKKGVNVTGKDFEDKEILGRDLHLKDKCSDQELISSRNLGMVASRSFPTATVEENLSLDVDPEDDDVEFLPDEEEDRGKTNPSGCSTIDEEEEEEVADGPRIKGSNLFCRSSCKNVPRLGVQNLEDSPRGRNRRTQLDEGGSGSCGASKLLPKCGVKMLSQAPLKPKRLNAVRNAAIGDLDNNISQHFGHQHLNTRRSTPSKPSRLNPPGLPDWNVLAQDEMKENRDIEPLDRQPSYRRHSAATPELSADLFLQYRKSASQYLNPQLLSHKSASELQSPRVDLNRTFIIDRSVVRSKRDDKVSEDHLNRLNRTFVIDVPDGVNKSVDLVEMKSLNQTLEVDVSGGLSENRKRKSLELLDRRSSSMNSPPPARKPRLSLIRRLSVALTATFSPKRSDRRMATIPQSPVLLNKGLICFPEHSKEGEDPWPSQLSLRTMGQEEWSEAAEVFSANVPDSFREEFPTGSEGSRVSSRRRTVAIRKMESSGALGSAPAAPRGEGGPSTPRRRMTLQRVTSSFIRNASGFIGGRTFAER